MGRIPMLILMGLALLTPGRANASKLPPSTVPPTADNAAAKYCLNPTTSDGKPETQVVSYHGQAITVVAVCVQNYQYVPGDDDVAPCVGYVDNAAVPRTSPACLSSGRPAAANKLEVPVGTTLLFVVPDPNMHTFTSDNCPNVFEDPTTVGPLPAAVGGIGVAGIGTAEQGVFGPDAITTAKGRCWFDSYAASGDKVLSGPGYETVATAGLPPGTYPFYCQVHAFMRGTLVIDRPRRQSK